jgi:membrane-associated phospholipid phosphatase
MRGEAIRRRATSGTRLGVSLTVVCLVAVALGFLVTGPVAPLLSRDLDAPARDYFLAHAPAGVSVLRCVGALGNPVVAASIVGVVCTIIGARTRRWAPLWAGAAAWLGAIVITVVVRWATSRTGRYGPIDGFPSGHAVIAASVFGTLVLLAAASALPRCWKRLVVVVGASAPVAVAWSRVALLDHVPSDVIGGVLLGATWSVAVVLAFPAPRPS